MVTLSCPVRQRRETTPRGFHDRKVVPRKAGERTVGGLPNRTGKLIDIPRPCECAAASRHADMAEVIEKRSGSRL